MELKHIVIAVDSFKGSISSMEAGKTAADAILSRYPSDSVEVFPLADGGEGTVDALVKGTMVRATTEANLRQTV
ncbi:MAG TPA: hypothetical protein DD660_08155 [Mitsuokella multacida]|nr:hypothetical protein [Mitsuokella multacida]